MSRTLLIHAAAALALPAVLGLALAPALAGGKGTAPVKVETKAGKVGSDGTQTVVVTLHINKPWHVYANPVGNEDLAAAQTTIVFPKGVKVVQAKYPAGKTINDKVIGKYHVYEGKVSIPIVIQRAGGAGPLELSVRYQACDDRRCLPPATAKARIE